MKLKKIILDSLDRQGVKFPCRDDVVDGLIQDLYNHAADDKADGNDAMARVLDKLEGLIEG